MGKHINKENECKELSCNKCFSINLHSDWVSVKNHSIMVAWVCDNCGNIILPENIESALEIG
jgi:RNase P subunit RPR2